MNFNFYQENQRKVYRSVFRTLKATENTYFIFTGKVTN